MPIRPIAPTWIAVRTALLVLLFSVTASADSRIAPVVRIDTTEGIAIASVGSNDGITKKTTCVFVDAKDHLISDDCRLVLIDKAESTCKTSTRLPEGARVKFSTP